MDHARQGEPAFAETEELTGPRSEKMQALEAVLILAHEPMSGRKLSQYANLADGTEALTLIRQLNRLYDEEGRAFRVEQVAGGFQLMTRPLFADWLRRQAGTPAEVRLSVPAMETLAVVGYRQPVLRADVEAIRGVACGEILRQLMERDLVRIQGRSEELGRPFLYGTTTRFLHVFGLASLDDLPRSEILRRYAPDGFGADHSSSTQTSVEGEKVVEMEANVIVMEAEEVMELGAEELASSLDFPSGGQTADELAFDDEEEVEVDDDDEFDDDEDEDDEDEDEDDEDDFDDDFDDDYDDDADEEWDDEEDEEDDEWEEVDDEDDEWDDEDEEEDDDEDEDWEDDDDE